MTAAEFTEALIALREEYLQRVQNVCIRYSQSLLGGVLVPSEWRPSKARGRRSQRAQRTPGAPQIGGSVRGPSVHAMRILTTVQDNPGIKPMELIRLTPGLTGQTRLSAMRYLRNLRLLQGSGGSRKAVLYSCSPAAPSFIETYASTATAARALNRPPRKPATHGKA